MTRAGPPGEGRPVRGSRPRTTSRQARERSLRGLKGPAGIAARPAAGHERASPPGERAARQSGPSSTVAARVGGSAPASPGAQPATAPESAHVRHRVPDRERRSVGVRPPSRPPELAL